jgi:solute:Na+ symporter, SSS family
MMADGATRKRPLSGGHRASAVEAPAGAAYPSGRPARLTRVLSAMETTTFGAVNWTVLAVFLVATTAIGHRLRGDPTRMEGFFLGGRSIPWWAVAASLIATKTSALTFIAVPGFIFAAGGDLRYLQITLGMILGNVLMAAVFIRAYYAEKIYSPYDFMENRLGAGVSQIARLLFFAGVVLSQAVRLLATGLVLSVITGLSLPECILIMGVFAAAWCLMGGITTVIWTDFIQWVIYTAGAVVVVHGARSLGTRPGFA